MSIKGIMQLQAVQEKSTVEQSSNVQKKVQAAVKDQKEISDQQYLDQVQQADKEKSAADTKNTATCIFAIFLGPIIGTFIGQAVGGWAGKGDSDDAAKLKKKVGVDDLQSQQADTNFNKAKDALQDNQKDLADHAKFSRELRDDKWTGL